LFDWHKIRIYVWGKIHFPVDEVKKKKKREEREKSHTVFNMALNLDPERKTINAASSCGANDSRDEKAGPVQNGPRTIRPTQQPKKKRETTNKKEK
jgi:hypothetical protein